MLNKTQSDYLVEENCCLLFRMYYYMSSIAFIGVLTLVRTDLLIRLIESIDYPVDTFAILFQGHTNINTECLPTNTFIKNLIFISCDMNIGVSRGWNYFFRNYSPKYWLITGDDNYFEKGSLEKIAQQMTLPDAKKSVFCGLQILYSDGTVGSSGFSTYIVTPQIMYKVGLFDENIYPAYFEDGDLWQRIVLSGESTYTIQDAYIHTGDDKQTGSCTIQSVSPEYRAKMDECYRRNEQYYKSKWQEGYTTPFNNVNYDIKDVIVHENYYKNQEILLGHLHEPTFVIWQ